MDEWLEENGFLEKSKHAPEHSHLLFSGGIYYVPRSREYEFLCKYAEEIDKGTKLYVVEARPKTFKFMVDIDISDNHYWSVEEVQNISAIIQKVVFEFFCFEKVAICCTSPEKIKGNKVHTGIHLIWPSIFVTSETALCIRQGIVQKIESIDELKLAKKWDDAIDCSIYTRNGYRMVGSDKMSKQDKSDVKIIENRPLSLLFVIDSDGNLNESYCDKLKKDTKRLVLETSIRYVIETYMEHGMNIASVPSWLKQDEITRRVGSRSHAGNVVSSIEHDMIEKFIERNLPKVYKGVVKTVVRYPKEEDYPHALLVKTTSRYCMNIGRKHNSCGVYFYATPNGMTQRCLCTCDNLDGRKNGLCMDYVSCSYDFDETTRNLLFPDIAENIGNVFEKNENGKKGKKGSGTGKKKKDTKDPGDKDPDDKDPKDDEKKKKKKEKKIIVFKPSSKKNIEKHQKSMCDNLFNSIMN